MWNCAACGVQNPEHALFCRRCGKMRAEVQPLVPREEAAPVKAAAEPEHSAEPVPPAWVPAPELPGCGFLAGWTAATAGAEFVAGIALLFLHRIFMWLPGRLSEELGYSIVLGALTGSVIGAAVGGAQTMTLSASVPGRRWSAWWVATAAAWFFGCILLYAAYHAFGVFKGEAGYARVVLGALFGVLVGAAQVFVLGKIAAAPGRALWILVNVFVGAMVGAVGEWVRSGLTRHEVGSPACLAPMVFYVILPLVNGSVRGLATGAVLMWILRRAAWASGERVPETGS